jgi:quercetin dioxygenase-like cupin family protein
MKTDPVPCRVNPAAETIILGPLTIAFLQTRESSGGSIAAFELTVPGGQRLMAPAHSHDHYEETIYGISGVITFTVDGAPVAIGPGQALCIPRGAVHRFDNFGSETARSLCVITPAEIGPEYFREMREALAASAGGPPDKAKLAAIMRRHGLTPAAPPPAAG